MVVTRERWMYVARRSPRHTRVWTAVLALLYSSFVVLGKPVQETGSVPWGDPVLYLALAAGAVIFYLALCALWAVLDSHRERQASSLARLGGRVPGAGWSERRWLATSLACLCAGWIPVWLASWPGYFCYDTNHFVNFIETGVLVSQQPVLHTLFVSLLVELGMGLFGTWNAGVATYVLVQVLILLVAALLLMAYLLRRDAPRWLLVATLAFLALDPAVSLFVSCTVKDTLFSVYLVALSLLLYESVRGARAGRGLRVALAVLTFLVLAYRSNAVIVVVLLLPFLVRAYPRTAEGRHARRSVLVWVGVGCLAFALWEGPVFSLLGVERSDVSAEAIAFPAVEISRSASYGDLDEALLESVGVDQGTIAGEYASAPHCADAVRWDFAPALWNGNYMGLLGLWANARSLHLADCVDADLALTVAAWYPGGIVDGYNQEGAATDFAYDGTETCTFAAWCEEPADQQSLVPWLSDALWHISRYDDPVSSPVAFPLMSVAAYLWLALLAFVRCKVVGDRAGTLYCTVLLLTVLTVLLCPMVLLRYYLYLVFSAPLFVWLLVAPRAGEASA